MNAGRYAPMDHGRVDELVRARLTYPAPGCSLSSDAAGWQLSQVLGRGPEDFDRASAALLTWQAHLGSGLRVVASADRITEGAVVDLFLGRGRFAVRAPCRVVAVVDEPGRRGFAYGTLPGHPERGEEAFLLDRGADGQVTFRVVAVSEPTTVVARLSGPVGRAFQRGIVRRYLTAMQRVIDRPVG